MLLVMLLLKKGKFMEWYVYKCDINRNIVTQWNIFNHKNFYDGCLKLIKNNLSKKDFNERLKQEIMYYFWGKCQYELIISPWVGKAHDIKISVFDQINMNFVKFSNYVWSFRKENNE